jgi:hypothetical protein
MTLEPGQVLKKLYSCKRCGADVLLQVQEIKTDGKAVWKQLEPKDGVTQHPRDCSKSKKQEEQQQPQPTLYDKISAIERKLDLLQQSMELLLKR